MTCKEKLKIEHPDRIDSYSYGGCQGCPHDYGYLVKPHYCLVTEDSCSMCWNREIPDTEKTIETTAKQYWDKYKALRHAGFTEDQAMSILIKWMDE
jgi:hypothetical protein